MNCQEKTILFESKESKTLYWMKSYQANQPYNQSNG